MAERSLDAETLALMRAFEGACSVQPVDCVETERRVVFVVPGDLVGKAVGKKGSNVRRLEDRLQKPVQVVGYSDDPADFAENFFFDVDVEGVEVEEHGDRRVVRVKVDPREKGRAIGRGGSNVKLASELAKRHHGVEVVVD